MVISIELAIGDGDFETFDLALYRCCVDAQYLV